MVKDAGAVARATSIGPTAGTRLEVSAMWLRYFSLWHPTRRQ
jgi:hypothetical protein